MMRNPVMPSVMSGGLTPTLSVRSAKPAHLASNIFTTGDADLLGTRLRGSDARKPSVALRMHHAWLLARTRLGIDGKQDADKRRGNSGTNHDVMLSV